MASSKLRILFLVDWYLPGYRAGGPIRSVSNLVKGLADEVECLILTTDRDLGDHRPYENIKTNTWIAGENGEHICYLSPDQLSRRRIRELIIESSADIVHLNSMYSKPFTIWPLMDHAKGKLTAKFILAPRGMLAKGSLSIKPIKKKVFLKMFKLKGWHKKIVFHASARHEIKEIRSVFGDGVEIKHLPNFPVPVARKIKDIPKKSGELKVICLTRIAQVKNVAFLIKAVGKCKYPIHLDIAGPREDMNYFGRCEEGMAKLPEHVDVQYVGEVKPANIAGKLSEYHLYALPTKGENFGHSIYEALAVGRPVLISDRTPWKALRVNSAGAEISDFDNQEWASELDRYAAMSHDEWRTQCSYALKYAIDRGDHDKLKRQYIETYDSLVN